MMQSRWRILSTAAALLIGSFLIGCPATMPTLNNQQAIAYEAVTFARQTCTALLRAKKTNVAQDQKCQANLSTVDAAIAAATTIEAVMQAKAQADAITTSNGGTPK